MQLSLTYDTENFVCNIRLMLFLLFKRENLFLRFSEFLSCRILFILHVQFIELAFTPLKP